MRQASGSFYTVATAALLVGIAAFLPGCSALRLALNRGVKPPVVSVTAARVERLTFTGARLMFEVQVENPNPVDLHIVGYDYAVEIGGHRIAHGTSATRTPVAGEATVSWQTPVAVSFASLLASVASLATEGETTFSFDCSVRLDLPFVGEVSVPVSRIGALPLPKLPHVSLAGVSVAAVSGTAVDLVLKLRVANPNDFLLRLESLTYEVGLAGNPLASASHDAAVEVFAGSSAIAELPVRVDLRSVGLAAAALLKDPSSAPLSLQGTMRLGVPLPQMRTAELPFSVGGASD